MQSETDLSGGMVRSDSDREFFPTEEELIRKASKRLAQDTKLAFEAQTEMNTIMDQFASLLQEEQNNLLNKADLLQRTSSQVKFPCVNLPGSKKSGCGGKDARKLSGDSESESEEEGAERKPGILERAGLVTLAKVESEEVEVELEDVIREVECGQRDDLSDHIDLSAFELKTKS